MNFPQGLPKWIDPVLIFLVQSTFVGCLGHVRSKFLFRIHIFGEILMVLLKFICSCWLSRSKFMFAKWGCPKLGLPPNGWCIWENPSMNGWFEGTPISGNLQILMSIRCQAAQGIAVKPAAGARTKPDGSAGLALQPPILSVSIYFYWPVEPLDLCIYTYVCVHTYIPIWSYMFRDMPHKQSEPVWPYEQDRIPKNKTISCQMTSV